MDFDADFHNDLPQAVAVGVFDGFHSGHQKIAQSVMDLSFPGGLGKTAVALEPVSRDPGLLTTTDEKMALLREAGFDNAVIFNKGGKWQDWSAESFIEDFMISKMNARYIVVGRDFRFGKDRSGEINMLRSLKGTGLEVVEVPFEEICGKKISSTYIRDLIMRGNMEEARKMLGRNHFFTGTLTRGHGIGSKIGFPTLNFDVSEDKLLPRGVFYVQVFSGLSSIPAAGACFIGNISNDQIPGSHFRVEVHLLEYDENIEKSINKVELVSMIREEKKFRDKEELRKQIGRDISIIKSVM